jgi:hypothetical protein
MQTHTQLEAPSVSEIFGPAVWHRDARDVANSLADQMLANHWHVDDLPWDSVPPLPIPAGGGSTHKLVRFYKSVVAVQTRAEEIAVSIARRLLLHANAEKLDVSFRRALAAMLNDEASHVATMIKLETYADAAYPGVEPRPGESRAFTTLMPAIETLEPAVSAVLMGAYEAAVAIRSYAEEQTYKLPSILAMMGRRAAEDDGRHAKTLRIIANEFLRIFRSRYGDDDHGASPAWRARILEPFRTHWTPMADHEYLLAGSDRRQLSHVYKVVVHDVEIMTRILNFLCVSPEAQAYAHVDISDLLPT